MTTFRIKKIIPPGRANNWLLWLIAAWVFIALPEAANAGHGAGVDLTYECINGCTTKVHFRAFRSCNTSIQNISPVNTFYITADTSCTMPVQTSPWVNVSNIEVTPVCAGTPTLCNSSTATINGIMEHYWVGEFDFCAANCSSYTLNWGLCCRNGTITSMSVPTMTTLYVGTTFNPLASPCNNSPVFNDPPIPYICEGQSHNFLQHASDPDGDSLAYFLGPCLSGPNTIVPYLPGYGAGAPLGPDWVVQIDPISGQLSISPHPFSPNSGSVQVGVVCILVEEWRNGQLIGTTTRDVQLTVLPCAGNDQPLLTGAANTIGATSNGFEITTCLGASLCFQIPSHDTDPGQTVDLYWDGSLSSMGASFTKWGDPAVMDTISGNNPVAEFCWTPPAAGTFQFVASVIDDHCDLPGFNQYTFTIIVEQIDITVVDTGLACDLAMFSAIPQTGSAPYSYQWNPLNFPVQYDSSFQQQVPGPGNYPYTMMVVDSAGCIFEYTDTLQVINNVQALPGLGQSICAGQPTLLGLQPPSNPNLVYQWSPAPHLNDSTLAQPTLTAINTSGLSENQSYYLLVVDTLTNCSDSDSVQLQVNPIPDASFFISPEICAGDTANILYTGVLNAFGTFLWNFDNGLPGTSISQGPHTVSWGTPGSYEVNLVVSSMGCSSPIQRDTILVKPIPVANIASEIPQCFTGHNFDLLNIGTYDSTATFDWNFSQGAVYTTDTTEHLDSLTFIYPGQHQVTLQVTQNGCDSPLDTLLLEIIPDPDPVWSYSSTGQCFPLNDFLFSATGQNDPSAVYNWTFQDGTPSVSSAVTQTVNFNSQGPKVVTLTVLQNGCSLSYTDTIQVYPSPAVDAGNGMSFCDGSAGGTLNGSVVGGQDPYVWNWFAGSGLVFTIDSLDDDDPHIMLDSSGFVYVQVTDQNGCSSELDSVWIEVLPKPIALAPADTSRCDGLTPCTVLIPTVSNTGGPFTYSWSPAAGLNDSTLLYPCASPGTTTTYTFVATDQGTGCSSDMGGIDSSAMVTVTVLPSPQAEAGLSFDLCNGDSIQLNGSASGSGPGYSYQWSPTTGLSNPNLPNPMASPAITTIYTLNVSSNGCDGYADTMHLRVRGIPLANAGNDVQICLGEQTQLNGSAGGGDGSSAYYFSWSNGVSLDDPLLSNPTALPSSTTTYHVTATNDWGCESAPDSITVYLHPTPVAEAGDSAFVCLGDEFQFQGSYYYGQTDSVPNTSLIYYNWNPGNELDDPLILQPTFTPTSSGWYTLEINYETCTTVDSVYLTSIPHLNASALADTNVVCANDSVMLLASGGLSGPTYQWTPTTGLNDPSSAQPMAAPGTTTTYEVFLEEYGCLDSTEITVEVLPRPTAGFAYTQPIGCPPHGVFFSSTSLNADHLIWNFGDGSPPQNISEYEHTYSEVGDYPVSLIAVAPGGCADTADFLTVQVTPPPHMNVVSDPGIPAELFVPNAEIQLTEDYGEVVEWQWIFENGDRFGGQVLDYSFPSEGTYFVTLRGVDERGCWNDTLVGPIVVSSPDITIYNVFSPNNDGINDVFLPLYDGSQPTFLQIFDRWGTLIFESRNRTEAWDGRNLKGKPSPEGEYFYTFRVGAKEYVGSVTMVR